MSHIAVGITGHRFLAEMDRILAGVEHAVHYLLKSFPESKFRILSSLAEGTDRILAKRLLAVPNASLWVPLPLQEEEYLKDFTTSASKQEFLHLLGFAERVIRMPVTEKAEAGYLAAGKYVLDNSECLMAIWDGKAAQGMAGTAEIVALARKRNLPLIWIHAGNRIPGTDTPTSLGSMQGKVTHERFPVPQRRT